MKTSNKRIKDNLNIIFFESIEKYVFLNLTANDLYKSFSNYEFKCKDEFDYVTSIILWVTYDLEDRIKYAEHLFSTINYKYCSKILMLKNSEIKTGNSILDDIIKQAYFKIFILNDTLAQFLKKIDIKSLNINLDETFINTKSKLTLSNKEILNLYNIKSDGIYNEISKCSISKYNFGDVTKVIYINNILFIFCSEKLYKCDILTFEITNCCPPQTSVYSGNSFSDIFLEKTIDNNIIIIGGLSKYTKSSKVKIYHMSEDKWIDYEPLPDMIEAQQVCFGNMCLYVICKKVTNKISYNIILKYSNKTWVEVVKLTKYRQVCTVLKITVFTYIVVMKIKVIIYLYLII